MLREGEVSTMAGSRYVLAEFSESSEGSYIRERLNIPPPALYEACQSPSTSLRYQYP